MDNKVSRALAGTIGHFWLDLEKYPQASASWQGHAEHRDHHFAIRTIKRPEEMWHLPTERVVPDAVYGVTEHGGIVAYDIRDVPEGSVLVGTKVAVRSYLARAFAVEVDPSELASPKVVALSAKFFGLARWAGVRGGKLDYTRDSHGRPTELTYTTQRVTPAYERISGGRTIELGVTWTAVLRQFDQFSASTPVTFTVTKSRPGSWYDFIRPVMRFQDLVSLAYDALVPCVGGYVIPHYKRGVDPTKCEMWSGQLMAVPEGVTRASETEAEHPAFSLACIGGPEGVRRWLSLAERHPRAVGPLTIAQRFGTSTVEVELMNVAVAIEYWVGACKREAAKRPKWTDTKKSNHAEVLARHVGSEFRDFVGGDEKKWARLFWDRYNALKHDPVFSYDSIELSTLMRGARVLLMCALLNRVACSKEPTRSICQSPEFSGLGLRTRRMMEADPKLFRR